MIEIFKTFQKSLPSGGLGVETVEAGTVTGVVELGTGIVESGTEFTINHMLPLQVFYISHSIQFNSNSKSLNCTKNTNSNIQPTLQFRITIIIKQRN